MTGQPRKRIVLCTRAAYSLMELFLVIAILSVVTMLVFPSLSKPLNQSVVQEAGQTLLRELTTARAEAIESGRTILFQYQEGTGRYYLGSSDQRGVSPAELSSFNSGPDQRAGATFNSNSADSSDRMRVQEFRPRSWDLGIRELVGPVTFVAVARRQLEEERFADGEDDARLPSDDSQDEKADEQELQPEDLSENRAEPAKWSAPLRFYPSGKMMPAHISLEAENGAAAEIEIQRLAGRIRLHVAK